MSLPCCHSCMASSYPYKEIQSLDLADKSLATYPSSCPLPSQHRPFTEARLCSSQIPFPPQDLCTWWFLGLEHFPLCSHHGFIQFSAQTSSTWRLLHHQLLLLSFPVFLPHQKKAFIFFIAISIAPRILPGLEWAFNEYSLKGMNEWAKNAKRREQYNFYQRRGM